MRLEPGRYRATWGEIATNWGFNTARQQLLAEAQLFVETVASVLPVCAVWIGGSFLTDKGAPGDVDMTVVFNVDQVDPSLVQLSSTAGLRQLATQLNVRVDAFALGWRSLLSGSPTSQTEAEDVLYRGYWDDWWLRERQGAKTAAPDRSWTLPRRGYLEVIIHDFK